MIRTFLAVVLIAGSAIQACDKASTLENATDAKVFIGDIVDNSHTKWKLGDKAGASALDAWLHQTTLRELSERIRAEPGWTCDSLEQLENLSYGLKVLIISDENRNLILVREEGTYHAEHEQIDSIINAGLKLSKSELVEIVRAACKVG